MPDRRQVGRQWRDLAQIQLAFARTVEVRPGRRHEAVLAGNIGILGILIGMMAAGNDLDRSAAQALELVEQRTELHRRVVVAPRMGYGSPTTGTVDPAHRLFQ